MCEQNVHFLNVKTHGTYINVDVPSVSKQRPVNNLQSRKPTQQQDEYSSLRGNSQRANWLER
jgi:hypothetical protein